MEQVLERAHENGVPATPTTPTSPIYTGSQGENYGSLWITVSRHLPDPPNGPKIPLLPACSTSSQSTSLPSLSSSSLLSSIPSTSTSTESVLSGLRPTPVCLPSTITTPMPLSLSAASRLAQVCCFLTIFSCLCRWIDYSFIPSDSETIT